MPESMKTELELVTQVPIPGAKIQTHRYSMSNKHLHRVMEVLSRMANAMIELDAGNSGAGMSRSEARDIWDDWTVLKHEWQRAQDNAGLPPTGGHETGLFIAFITQTQVLAIGNVRIRSVLNGLLGLADRVLNADSAKQEFDIQAKDAEYIQSHIDYVEGILSDYVGTVTGAEFNRGLSVAAHTHLGTVVPPENLGLADAYEPSHVAAAGPSPDVPDAPSGIPAPGSKA